ncbi:MAG TPA: ribonuclease R [Gemmatimonadota bacterium]|nr:ribonuclease R [Gemmatimonadota bacterium]
MSPDRPPVERDKVLEFLRATANRPMRAKELARGLEVSQEDYRAFRRLLDTLEADGAIVRQRKGRYAVPEQFDLVPGRLQVTRKGDGFVIPDEPGEDDVFVPARNLETAVDGDRVLARIEQRPPGRNPAGRIVRVVERAWTQIAGIYHPKEGYGFVVPQEPDIGTDVFIPAGSSGDATDGDVVVITIENWGEGRPSPVGRVEQVLGPQGGAGVDVLAILIGHQLALDFPSRVQDEAEKISRQGIRPESLHDREDLRDRLTFTIDPADARDHDDAISVYELDDGEVEIGVHIADVSWYVKPGSAIDQEAEERATSVYLVDRVVPMLPEELSAGLCSLVPDEDRLTMTVLYRMDMAGNVKEARAMRSVIRSRARLSYEDANAMLEAPAADETSAAMHTLRKVCRGIRARRAERGSIDFALPETYVELDDDGMPTAIRPRPRLETNRIVEDLMILTNETVARIGEQHELPVLYRIHEPPSEDRLESLRRVAGVFDAPLTADPVRPPDVARLVEKMAGRPQEYLVSMVALRSMKQARYSTRNVGHFGLGSDAYLHFTSPIRRYPDLVVHRALVRWLAGKDAEVDLEALERTARHTSERERRAEAAERDSVELKKIQYMTRHLGDTFEGTIAGVTGFGMFILLDEVLVEGLVRLSSLVDDYYHYDEESWSLTGRRSKRRFQLGDRVEVQVARVDPESREIDLELLKGPLDPGRSRD